MADSKNMSNTMEINSILEEARARSAQNAAKPSDYPTAVYNRVSDFSEEMTDINAPKDDNGDGFVFIDEDGSYRPSDTAKKKAKKNAKKNKMVLFVVLGVVLLAAIGGFTWYMLSGNATTFADNVYISGVSLGGKNMAEAREAMKSVEQDLADQIRIDVTAGDNKITLTKDDLSYSFNTEEVLAQAKAYSEQKGLKSGTREYEVIMTIDAGKATDIAAAIAKEVDAEAADAYVTAFDSSKQDMFTYEEEVVGLELDKDAFTSQLREFLGEGKFTGTLDAAVKTVEPKYTVAYLERNIKRLSSFTTTSTNNSNGNENMRVSLGACNNSIIDPGQIWSFNNCTGDSNLESNGYKPAGVIVEGRHETGVGGGICQSSTTIYNATLLCGMEVIERSCHYYKSVYVDAGRDATVDYGNLDLKMKNPFDYQLFMKCYMDGTVLHCEMYGLENPEFDEVKISTSSPSYFSTGYKVSATRTYYKDGAKVRSDNLPNSTYYTVEPGSSNSSKKNNSSSSRSSASSSAASSTPAASSASDDGGADPGDTIDGGDAGGSDSGDSGDAGGSEGGAEDGGGEE